MLYSHHGALAFAYAVACGGWLLIGRAAPSVWPSKPRQRWEHPWREVAWALVAVLFVLAVGQAYGAGLLLPREGTLGVLFESINQALIFAPMVGLLVLRRHSLSTAWLPTRMVWARIGVGFGLALLALLVFTLVRAESNPWPVVVSRVYHPGNLALAVQVFLEDVAIAILFVRFADALGVRTTIVVVAALFAAAHIPAMLQGGEPWTEVTRLSLDAALAAGVLSVVQRSADIWWFWMVHFALDMSQYHGVPAAV